MIKIALQAGHQNIKSNCNVNLRGSTGAPGEAEFTVKARNALAKKLAAVSKDIQVTSFDANVNCQDVASQDFHLFLALHYDADVYGTGGGFADYPDPSVDAVSDKSKELATKINSIYFPLTGIAYHPERSNGNTKYYYAWQHLSAKTPCVLIECGTNNRDNLPNRIDEITTVLTNAICEALRIPNSSPEPTTPPPVFLFTDQTIIPFGYEIGSKELQAARSDIREKTKLELQIQEMAKLTPVQSAIVGVLKTFGL